MRRQRERSAFAELAAGMAFVVAAAWLGVGCSSSGGAPAQGTAGEGGAGGDAAVDGSVGGDGAAGGDGGAHPVDCGGTHDGPAIDGGGASIDGGAASDGGPGADAAAPCTTTITYGSAWIHGASHPAPFDVADGKVTWDGTCGDDGTNSYAQLSNGFKPYFQGLGGCILALDYAPSCGVAATCATRVSYGSAWLAPAGHTAQYDDVAGRVFGDGVCHASGGQSYADLSNGWQPHFNGANACSLSFSHTQCGGLYANPVIPVDCPDPGVLHDGSQYVLTCTSGGAADAYPIYTSPDLATWTLKGHVFPSANKPTWATGDFWAPEIHRVGSQYVVYFSARATDGKLSVGAASAATPLGPFKDIGQPLVHDPNMGLIDASEINAANGTSYVLWKEDGNAVGKPTPIHAQPLAADGLSLTGSPSTLITNDQAWEGSVTEGPFMVQHAGTYYLFYSGNGYAGTAYAVGVAQSSSPTGPFTKPSGPIVVTGGAWAGPGHCSVVDTPAGDTAIVYHAWEASHVGASPGRLVLLDLIAWQNGWPGVPLGPSSTSRPLP